LKTIAYAFMPTLIRNWYSDEPETTPKPRGTAYLDGARGLAALVVFNYHFFYAYSDITQAAWDFRNPLSMPILRLWSSGASAVPLFFIFGGYAIATKPLSQMQKDGKEGTEAALVTLSSSAFRRIFRLYLPTAMITLMVAILIELRIYEYTRSILQDTSTTADLLRLREKHLEISGSAVRSLTRWLWDILMLSGLWDWKSYAPYHDRHLWTIQTEYVCSIVVYVTLLATAQLKAGVRLLVVMILSIHCLYWSRWDVADFYWGVILAQLDTILDSSFKARQDGAGMTSTLPQSLEKSSISPRQSHLKHAFQEAGLHILLLFSFWCISAPAYAWNTAFGYQTLAKLVPSHYGAESKFIPAVGVVLLQRCLYISSPKSPRRAMFTNSVALYLGKISFSLYLVHGPVLHAVGYSIPSLIWSIIGKEGIFGYGFGLVVGWVVSLILALCAADVFHREIEARCILFTAWIERHCLKQ